MTPGDTVSLTHARRRAGTRPPILLVPGSFSGAWIWRDSFQPALHKAGYDVHAMSFAARRRYTQHPTWQQSIAGAAAWLTALPETLSY